MEDKPAIPPFDGDAWLDGTDAGPPDNSRLVTVQEMIAWENGADYACRPGEVSQGVLDRLAASGATAGRTVPVPDVLAEIQVVMERMSARLGVPIPDPNDD